MSTPAAATGASGSDGARGSDGVRGSDSVRGSVKGSGSRQHQRQRAGAVDVGRARSALDLFDQVRAMTWRLLHARA